MPSGIRRKLLSQGAALTIGTVVQVLSGFATQIILMRHLMPEDFGGFAFTMAGCSLIQTILSLRLNVLIIRLPQTDNTLHELYCAALAWETLAAAVVTLSWLLIAGLVSGPVLILLAAMTCGQWVNQALAFYERRMDYGRIAAVETLSQVAGHITALLLVFLGAGALCLYLRELVAVLCRLVAFYKIQALPALIWRRPTTEALRILWRQSRGIWSEGILEGMFSRLVILISGNLAGLHGAGLLAQSQRLAILPHQILSPVISRMSTNLFSRSCSEEARNRLAMRLAIFLAMLLLPAIIFTWLWAAPLVPWLFGEHWRDSGLILKSMIGVIFFLSLFDLLRSFCYAAHKVQPVLWGRLAQITAFTIPALWWSDANIENLGWTLSAAHAAAFLVTAILTLRVIRRSPLTAD